MKPWPLLPFLLMLLFPFRLGSVRGLLRTDSINFVCLHRRYLSTTTTTTTESTTQRSSEYFASSNFTGIASQPPGSLVLPPGPIPLPRGLSPSAALEFKACPQSFMLRYLFKLREPTNPVLAKGTMVHSALEKVYDFPAKQRTLPLLHNLLRESWSDAKTNKTDDYGSLFDTVEDEREWGLECLKLLDNYYDLEDPSKLEADPVRRETWVRANLTSDLLVRGIVDRLDLTRAPDGEVVLCVTDYKTGKAPDLKYAPSTNERIMEEKFWQLKVYALLLRNASRKQNKQLSDENERNGLGNETAFTSSVPVRMLRLMFMTSCDGRAKTFDYDLGSTDEERDASLDKVEDELTKIWNEIKGLVEQSDTTAFTHCDRKFCMCHKSRDVFVDGLAGQN